MAQSQRTEQSELISGINVTPLVDVVLVLLVILMVTANYVASRAIPVDLPKSSTGESVAALLTVSVDAQGQLYLDGTPVTEQALASSAREKRVRHDDTHALISADGAVSHRHVVRVVDVLRREGVTRLGFNVRPEDLK